MSGNLVGMIGSSNNPISGLTLCDADHRRAADGRARRLGHGGVAAVLGVAAVVCVSSAVAGEMLQDFKVGHILGGTPRKMQIGDFMGVVVASFALSPVLFLLIRPTSTGGIASAIAQLSAPQAGLMAMLAKGIVGGDMAWPLVIVGILLGIRADHDRSEEPDAVCGRHVSAARNDVRDLRGRRHPLDHRQAARPSRLQRCAEGARGQCGSADRSGLIAGEALMGLVIAGFRVQAMAVAGDLRAS